VSADFADLYGGVQSALSDILGGSSRRQQQPQPSAYDAYMQSLYQGPAGVAQGPAPLGAYDPAAAQALYSGPGGQQGYADPAALYRGPGGQQDSGGALFAGPGQVGSAGSGGFLAQANAGVDAARAQARAEQRGLSGTATEAGDWSGPATADDNATLDGAKIDSWIAATRPNSPLRGKGSYILQVANQNGVSAPLLLGIFLKESELGTTAGPGYNIAGVGGEGNFAQYGSWEQAIDGAARNLGGPTYKGKSAQDQIGYWFTGKPGDLNATDSTGGRNGTVRSYLDGPVAAAYSGLGVPFNAAVGGTRKAGGGTVVSPDGAYFPVAGWTQPVQPHWGRGDATGGTDIMAPAGSQIVAVRGGQVTYAAYDPTGGWAVMIQGDDGLAYYYAHMSQAPSVQAGQRIGAGTGLGLVGNTGDASGGSAHLHLGIGPQIRQGRDAWGGTGEYADGRQFDAVSYLNRILSSRTSGRGGGTGSRRS
jgi:murein DD-endopeptidase MepM/ murein hydrolase activator NlpD